jgi:hypothetical protein
MSTKSITVTVSSIGASAGPFNISDNVLGVVAMNVTRSQLLAGYPVNVDVNATVITVTSIGTCTTSLNINLSTPTPTPTPTITPTPTVSPTPTQAPIYFDSNFTNSSNNCGSGGRIWSRLVAPAGTTVEFTVTSQQFITSINSVSASISGILYETVLPASIPALGTVVTSSYASVTLAGIPTSLTNTQVTTVTSPSIGYKDYILVYRTNNLASNFTNGQATVTITKVNGVSVVNGGSLSTSYNCSDVTYYDYSISSVGYANCGAACDSTVLPTTTVYATVSNENLLVAQYLYTKSGTTYTLWTGGDGLYHRITRVGNMGNGYSAVVIPTGRVVSVNTCTSVSPGTCG